MQPSIKYIGIIFWLLAIAGLSCQQPAVNHLANASSPYLQSHAKDPVNWYEWGPAALKKAKEENKPILISIGYAACHWCHEMQDQSYKDTGIARVMNEQFVCIKVDREERPDIDGRYTDACELLNGSSGWPLHAFALPDGRPFFAGTYYPPKNWLALLQQVSKAYKTQQNKVVLQAQGIANGIAAHELSLLSANSNRTFTKNDYNKTFDSLRPMLDTTNGGISGGAKFPTPYLAEFLLQYSYLTNNEQALSMAGTMLDKMAMGGIYDHAGGGFARYATDSAWRYPHFEKMLNDNAQLLSVYAHAYQLTKKSQYKIIIEETAAFMQRELARPEGGYYSSLNADTKEGEGIFYSWTLEAFNKLPSPYLKQMADYYNVTAAGNWLQKRNILFTKTSADAFAQAHQINQDDFQQQLTTFKKQLLQEREKKIKPSADKKMITGWNALAVKGWLDAFHAVGDSSYLLNAMATASFIEKNMLQQDGRLWRCYTDGKLSVPGMLDDYAYLCEALIQLYQTTFDKHWLSFSQSVAEKCLQQFSGNGNHGLLVNAAFADSNNVQKLLLTDNGMPSPNAVMARQLYFLSVYFQNKQYAERASGMLSSVYGQLQKKDVLYYTSWCFLSGLLSYGSYEVAIIGPDATVKNLQLQKDYLPQAVFMGSLYDENLPLLQGKRNGDKTIIYVCTNNACKAPVQLAELAALQLRRPTKQ